MKKIILCLGILLSFTCLKIEAKDTTSDYDEEIQMFSDFYESPSTYSFQNDKGQEINSYILSKHKDFKNNPEKVTRQMMKHVSSVIDYEQVLSDRAGKNKIWKNLKVYYTSSKYVQYDFKETANIKNSKVSSVKGTAYNLRKLYSDKYTIVTKTNFSKNKASFNISHIITKSNVKMKKIQ